MTYARHAITNAQWAKIQGFLPGEKGTTGRDAVDNRNFVNAVLWKYKTGCPWRDLPERFGDWKNIHRRWSRWTKKGIW